MLYHVSRKYFTGTLRDRITDTKLPALAHVLLISFRNGLATTSTQIFLFPPMGRCPTSPSRFIPLLAAEPGFLHTKSNPTRFAWNHMNRTRSNAADTDSRCSSKHSLAATRISSEDSIGNIRQREDNQFPWKASPECVIVRDWFKLGSRSIF